MTKLDVPQPIIMDVNRIGDDFNIISIVTNKIGEYRADKGFHTAAGGETRQISARGFVFLVPRHDNYGYTLGLAIPEELLEARIKLDI